MAKKLRNDSQGEVLSFLVSRRHLMKNILAMFRENYFTVQNAIRLFRHEGAS